MEEVKPEDRRWCVYMHTNKINNKVYVGQTCLNPERRWRKDGAGYKNCTYFWRAIQKYGWDSFEHIIVAENLTKEEADTMEKDLIALYDTTNILKGYNLTCGGDNTELTEEVRKKISENHADVSGENNPFYGKSHSEETKEKIRIKNKVNFAKENNPMYGVHRYGESAPMYGKHHTKETKIKIGMTRKGKYVGENNPNYGKGKPIIQLTLDGEVINKYNSVAEATRCTGISSQSIYRCCYGKQKSAGGFKWMRE